MACGLYLSANETRLASGVWPCSEPSRAEARRGFKKEGVHRCCHVRPNVSWRRERELVAVTFTVWSTVKPPVNQDTLKRGHLDIEDSFCRPKYYSQLEEREGIGCC